MPPRGFRSVGRAGDLELVLFRSAPGLACFGRRGGLALVIYVACGRLACRCLALPGFRSLR